jgi:hypothetical protein
MAGKKQKQSIDSRVLRRILAHGTGWVFTPDAFLDLGSRMAIDHALSRYARSGRIRRLARGLYDYPVRHAKLGVLAPESDDVAKALMGRDAVRLQPSGAYAANLLGLSGQVPMKVTYLTDGPTKRVKLGNQEIILRRTTPRNMVTAGRISGLVIQALRHIGQRNADDKVISILCTKLTRNDKNQLLKDIRYAPGWIAAIMKQIAQDERG